MKILIIDNCYPDFLAKLESDLAKKNETDYKKILKYYYNQAFGTSDFYSRNLKKLGHQASDIIINFDRLQSAWAKENSLILYYLSKFLKATPKVRNYYQLVGNPILLLEQIKRTAPDVVYVQCIGSIPPIIARQIKKHTKLLVGQIASKMLPDRLFQEYDLVLSSLPNIVNKVRKLGVNSEYFRIGFESTVLKKIKKTGKKYDVTHLGGYGPIHNERNLILEEAAKKVNIDFWGYGINNLSENSPIRKNYHGEAWGMDYYNTLANSKITLTAHIKSVAANYANNMTLYEATGCGAMLMTDDKKKLDEMFEIGKEIVVYKSAEDLAKKVKYYLGHEDERKKIAKAGQKRTLKEHSYLHRMKELVEILEKYA